MAHTDDLQGVEKMATSHGKVLVINLINTAKSALLSFYLMTHQKNIQFER